MKVYILLKMIDMGDHIFSVYEDEYLANKRKEELNNEYKKNFPNQTMNSPYFVEEHEVLGNFYGN